MTEEPDLGGLRRKWSTIEEEEETRVYGLLTGDNPSLEHEALLREDEMRGIPRLTVATHQLRNHSRRLTILTAVLVALTGILACLTAILILKG